MVSLQYRDEYVEALLKEISLRATYLYGSEVKSIYFGGGTPSVLTPSQLERILDALRMQFNVKEGVELTLEANPDDLSDTYLEVLGKLSFNRLSIGVQSFQSAHLELLRRSHTADQGIAAVERAAARGFRNINMDLIYGIPGLSAEEWTNNLQRAVALPVMHISAYHLTFETGTVFDHWKKLGRITEINEEESERQYNTLRRILGDHGFDHYEISNFAREGYYSRHNRIYWNNKKYLGLGPAAHSYNGMERSWNVSSLKKYIQRTGAGAQIFESETIDQRTAYHDYLITTLRTTAGADIKHISQAFNESISRHFLRVSGIMIEQGILIHKGDRISIDPGRWITSDGIIRRLMLDD
jgi:oxygen-independent coproporphyrinogen-3 oxidase